MNTNPIFEDFSKCIEEHDQTNALWQKITSDIYEIIASMLKYENTQS